MGFLSEKVILVTGAASGIGRATGIKLAQEGARVCLIDSDADQLQQTVDMASQASNDVIHQCVDIRNESAWQTITESVLARWQVINGLANCAHVDLRKSIKDTSLTEFQEALAFNLEASFLGMKSVYLAMKANEGGGSIVNVSSVNGQLALPERVADTASNGGVRLMTKAAAIEFGMANTLITVNSVHPGSVQGNPQDHSFDAVTPLKKTATPEDVANAICFLLYDGAKFMTGSEVTVDGGWSCGLPLPHDYQGV